jgi:hypothetical protein
MTRNILNVPTGDTFCRIFLHQLVNAPVNVVKTLEIVFGSSRDGVPLGPKRTLSDKPAYQNGSIDSSFGPHPAPLDSTFNIIHIAPYYATLHIIS